MSASGYTGRVGGLAVALGVGAAVLGGTPISWADDPAAGSGGVTGASASPGAAGRRSSDTGSSTAAESPGAGTPGGRRGPAARFRNPEPQAAVADDGRSATPACKANADSAIAAPDSATAVAPAAAEPAPAAAPADIPAVADVPSATTTEIPTAADNSSPDSDSASSRAPAAEIAAVPAAAPASAPVSGFLAAALDVLGDPFAGGNPGVPVDTPLNWTMLAFARRQPLTANAVARSAATTPASLIMGPSGVPVPSVGYGEIVMAYYIPDNPPGTQQLVFTPEGLYPITGVRSLPLNVSVDQGIQIIARTLEDVPAGTPTTVFGYSQSAIISSLLQSGYPVKDVDYTVPEGLPVSFVLVGNEMNPDGGFLSRFSGRDLPLFNFTSLGVPFYGATPENLYPTTNYTQQYDGFGDFPRYPLNFLADLNAGLGIVYVHTKYTPNLATCTSFCLTEEQVRNAIPLPTTSPTQNYYFIPIENLPLLQPLRTVPVIGNPLADLLQPVLKVIVNLGYGDPAHGFSTGKQPYANVLVPFGVFPEVDPAEVFSQLSAGLMKGIDDFAAALQPNGSVAQELSAMAVNTGPSSTLAAGDPIATVQNLINSFADYVSGAAASIYAALLPTADIINSLLTTLPAYEVNLFLYGVQQMLNGQIIDGLVNSVGLPLAAHTGLVTMAGLISALVWGQAFGQALEPIIPDV